MGILRTGETKNALNIGCYFRFEKMSLCKQAISKMFLKSSHLNERLFDLLKKNINMDYSISQLQN